MSSLHQEVKKARTFRTEYDNEVESIQSWVQSVEYKIQTKDDEPQVLEEALHEIHCEFGAIKTQFERVKQNGALICENSRDEDDEKRIEATVSSLSAQLEHVNTWLDDRRAQVGSSLDSWQSFIQIFNGLRTWIEKQKMLLDKPLKFSSLSEAKSALYEYKMVVKETKWSTKQVNDMNTELIKIEQISSVGSLSEKLAEIEQERSECEGKLKETLGLLTEMTEEWEQCEQKARDVSKWLEKTSQSLTSSHNKKQALRDQLAFRESTLSNVAVHKTKLVLAMEKLKVHFKDRISADAQVSSEIEELQLKLDNLSQDLIEECKALETCVHQTDIYQKDVLKLRQNVLDVEQQLRLVSSPSYCALDRDKALAEQCKMIADVEDLENESEYLVNEGKLLGDDQEVHILVKSLNGLVTRLQLLKTEALVQQKKLLKEEQTRTNDEIVLLQLQQSIQQIKTWVDDVPCQLESDLGSSDRSALVYNLSLSEKLVKDLTRKSEQLNELYARCSSLKTNKDEGQPMSSALMAQIHTLKESLSNTRKLILERILQLKDILSNQRRSLTTTNSSRTIECREVRRIIRKRLIKKIHYVNGVPVETEEIIEEPEEITEDPTTVHLVSTDSISHEPSSLCLKSINNSSSPDRLCKEEVEKIAGDSSHLAGDYIDGTYSTTTVRKVTKKQIIKRIAFINGEPVETEEVIEDPEEFAIDRNSESFGEFGMTHMSPTCKSPNENTDARNVDLNVDTTFCSPSNTPLGSPTRRTKIIRKRVVKEVVYNDGKPIKQETTINGNFEDLILKPCDLSISSENVKPDVPSLITSIEEDDLKKEVQSAQIVEFPEVLDELPHISNENNETIHIISIEDESNDINNSYNLQEKLAIDHDSNCNFQDSYKSEVIFKADEFHTEDNLHPSLDDEICGYKNIVQQKGNIQIEYDIDKTNDSHAEDKRAVAMHPNKYETNFDYEKNSLSTSENYNELVTSLITDDSLMSVQKSDDLISKDQLDDKIKITTKCVKLIKHSNDFSNGDKEQEIRLENPEITYYTSGKNISDSPIIVPLENVEPDDGQVMRYVKFEDDIPVLCEEYKEQTPYGIKSRKVLVRAVRKRKTVVKKVEVIDGREVISEEIIESPDKFFELPNDDRLTDSVPNISQSLFQIKSEEYSDSHSDRATINENIELSCDHSNINFKNDVDKSNLCPLDVQFEECAASEKNKPVESGENFDSSLQGTDKLDEKKLLLVAENYHDLSSSHEKKVFPSSTEIPNVKLSSQVQSSTSSSNKQNAGEFSLSPTESVEPIIGLKSNEIDIDVAMSSEKRGELSLPILSDDKGVVPNLNSFTLSFPEIESEVIQPRNSDEDESSKAEQYYDLVQNEYETKNIEGDILSYDSEISVSESKFDEPCEKFHSLKPDFPTSLLDDSQGELDDQPCGTNSNPPSYSTLKLHPYNEGRHSESPSSLSIKYHTELQPVEIFTKSEEVSGLSWPVVLSSIDTSINIKSYQEINKISQDITNNVIDLAVKELPASLLENILPEDLNKESSKLTVKTTSFPFDTCHVMPRSETTLIRENDSNLEHSKESLEINNIIDESKMPPCHKVIEKSCKSFDNDDSSEVQYYQKSTKLTYLQKLEFEEPNIFAQQNPEGIDEESEENFNISHSFKKEENSNTANIMILKNNNVDHSHVKNTAIVPQSPQVCLGFMNEEISEQSSENYLNSYNATCVNEFASASDKDDVNDLKRVIKNNVEAKEVEVIGGKEIISDEINTSPYTDFQLPTDDSLNNSDPNIHSLSLHRNIEENHDLHLKIGINREIVQEFKEDQSNAKSFDNMDESKSCFSNLDFEEQITVERNEHVTEKESNLFSLKGETHNIDILPLESKICHDNQNLHDKTIEFPCVAGISLDESSLPIEFSSAVLNEQIVEELCQSLKEHIGPDIKLESNKMNINVEITSESEESFNSPVLTDCKDFTLHPNFSEVTLKFPDTENGIAQLHDSDASKSSKRANYYDVEEVHYKNEDMENAKSLHSSKLPTRGNKIDDHLENFPSLKDDLLLSLSKDAPEEIKELSHRVKPCKHSFYDFSGFLPSNEEINDNNSTLLPEPLIESLPLEVCTNIVETQTISWPVISSSNNMSTKNSYCEEIALDFPEIEFEVTQPHDDDTCEFSKTAEYYDMDEIQYKNENIGSGTSLHSSEIPIEGPKFDDHFEQFPSLEGYLSPPVCKDIQDELKEPPYGTQLCRQHSSYNTSGLYSSHEKISDNISGSLLEPLVESLPVEACASFKGCQAISWPVVSSSNEMPTLNLNSEEITSNFPEIERKISQPNDEDTCESSKTAEYYYMDEIQYKNENIENGTTLHSSEIPIEKPKSDDQFENFLSLEADLPLPIYKNIHDKLKETLYGVQPCQHSTYSTSGLYPSNEKIEEDSISTSSLEPEIESQSDEAYMLIKEVPDKTQLVSVNPTDKQPLSCDSEDTNLNFSELGVEAVQPHDLDSSQSSKAVNFYGMENCQYKNETIESTALLSGTEIPFGQSKSDGHFKNFPSPEGNIPILVYKGSRSEIKEVRYEAKPINSLNYSTSGLHPSNEEIKDECPLSLLPEPHNETQHLEMCSNNEENPAIACPDGLNSNSITTLSETNVETHDACQGITNTVKDLAFVELDISSEINLPESLELPVETSPFYPDDYHSVLHCETASIPLGLQNEIDGNHIHSEELVEHDNRFDKLMICQSLEVSKKDPDASINQNSSEFECHQGITNLTDFPKTDLEESNSFIQDYLKNNGDKSKENFINLVPGKRKINGDETNQIVLGDNHHDTSNDQNAVIDMQSSIIKNISINDPSIEAESKGELKGLSTTEVTEFTNDSIQCGVADVVNTIIQLVENEIVDKNLPQGDKRKVRKKKKGKQMPMKTDELETKKLDLLDHNGESIKDEDCEIANIIPTDSKESNSPEEIASLPYHDKENIQIFTEKVKNKRKKNKKKNGEKLIKDQDLASLPPNENFAGNVEKKAQRQEIRNAGQDLVEAASCDADRTAFLPDDNITLNKNENEKNQKFSENNKSTFVGNEFGAKFEVGTSYQDRDPKSFEGKSEVPQDEIIEDSSQAEDTTNDYTEKLINNKDSVTFSLNEKLITNIEKIERKQEIEDSIQDTLDDALHDAKSAVFLSDNNIVLINNENEKDQKLSENKSAFGENEIGAKFEVGDSYQDDEPKLFEGKCEISQNEITEDLPHTKDIANDNAEKLINDKNLVSLPFNENFAGNVEEIARRQEIWDTVQDIVDAVSYESDSTAVLPDNNITIINNENEKNLKLSENKKSTFAGTELGSKFNVETSYQDDDPESFEVKSKILPNEIVKDSSCTKDITNDNIFHQKKVIEHSYDICSTEDIMHEPDVDCHMESKNVYLSNTNLGEELDITDHLVRRVSLPSDKCVSSASSVASGLDLEVMTEADSFKSDEIPDLTSNSSISSKIGDVKCDTTDEKKDQYDKSIDLIDKKTNIDENFVSAPSKEGNITGLNHTAVKDLNDKKFSAKSTKVKKAKKKKGKEFREQTQSLPLSENLMHDVEPLVVSQIYEKEDESTQIELEANIKDSELRNTSSVIPAKIDNDDIESAVIMSPCSLMISSPQDNEHTTTIISDDLIDIQNNECCSMEDNIRVNFPESGAHLVDEMISNDLLEIAKTLHSPKIVSTDQISVSDATRNLTSDMQIESHFKSANSLPDAVENNNDGVKECFLPHFSDLQPDFISDNEKIVTDPIYSPENELHDIENSSCIPMKSDDLLEISPTNGQNIQSNDLELQLIHNQVNGGKTIQVHIISEVVEILIEELTFINEVIRKKLLPNDNYSINFKVALQLKSENHSQLLKVGIQQGIIALQLSKVANDIDNSSVLVTVIRDIASLIEEIELKFFLLNQMRNLKEGKKEHDIVFEELQLVTEHIVTLKEITVSHPIVSHQELLDAINSSLNCLSNYNDQLKVRIKYHEDQFNSISNKYQGKFLALQDISSETSDLKNELSTLREDAPYIDLLIVLENLLSKNRSLSDKLHENIWYNIEISHLGSELNLRELVEIQSEITGVHIKIEDQIEQNALLVSKMVDSDGMLTDVKNLMNVALAFSQQKKIIEDVDHLEKMILYHKELVSFFYYCQRLLRSNDSFLELMDEQRCKISYSDIQRTLSLIIKRENEEHKTLSLIKDEWKTLLDEMNQEKAWLSTALKEYEACKAVLSENYKPCTQRCKDLLDACILHRARAIHFLSVSDKINKVISTNSLKMEVLSHHQSTEELHSLLLIYLGNTNEFHVHWSLYQSQFDQLQEWANLASTSLKQANLDQSDPVLAKEHLNLVSNLRAQYGSKNMFLNECISNFDKSVRLLPLSDEDLQRQLFSQFRDEWLELGDFLRIKEQQLQSFRIQSIPTAQLLSETKDDLKNIKVILESLDTKSSSIQELRNILEKYKVLKIKIDNCRTNVDYIRQVTYKIEEPDEDLIEVLDYVVLNCQELNSAIHCRISALEFAFNHIYKCNTRFEKLSLTLNDIDNSLENCKNIDRADLQLLDGALHTCSTIDEMLNVVKKDIKRVKQDMENLHQDPYHPCRFREFEENISKILSKSHALSENIEVTKSNLQGSLERVSQFTTASGEMGSIILETKCILEGIDIIPLEDIDYFMQIKVDLERLQEPMLPEESRPEALEKKAKLIGKEDAGEAQISKWNNTTNKLREVLKEYNNIIQLWINFTALKEEIQNWAKTKYSEINYFYILLADESKTELQVLVGEAKKSNERVNELREIAEEIQLRIYQNNGRKTTTLVNEVERLGLRINHLADAIHRLNDQIAEQPKHDKRYVKNNGEEIKDIKELLELPSSKSLSFPEKSQLLQERLLSLSCAIESSSPKFLGYSENNANDLIDDNLKRVYKEYEQVVSKLGTDYQQLQIAIRSWNEYIDSVTEVLASPLPISREELHESVRLCQVHSSILSTQRKVLTSLFQEAMKDNSSPKLINLQSQLRELIRRNNTTFSALTDRSEKLNKTICNWETYRAKIVQIQTWLQNLEHEKMTLELRQVPVIRLDKVTNRLETILLNLNNGSSQMEELMILFEKLLSSCDEGSHSILKAEPNSLQQRINNMKATLETWLKYLKDSKELWEKQNNLYQEIRERLKTSETNIVKNQSGEEDTKVLINLYRNYIDDLESLNGDLAEYKSLREKMGDCFIPTDVRIVANRLWRLTQLKGDLIHQCRLKINTLEDSIEMWELYSVKYRDFIKWTAEIEHKIDGESELYIDSLIKKLEWDYENEIGRNQLQKLWLTNEGESLLKSSNRERKKEISEMLESVEYSWKNILKKIKLKKDKLIDIVEMISKMEVSLAELKSWLFHIEKDLSSPVLFRSKSLSEIHKLLAIEDEMKAEIEQQSQNISSVLNLCEIMIQDCNQCGAGGETGSLQLSFQYLEKRWGEICARSAERQNFIKKTKKVWEDLFRSHKAFTKWLKGIEYKVAKIETQSYFIQCKDIPNVLVFTHQLYEDIYSQMKNLEDINNKYRLLARPQGRENQLDQGNEIKQMVKECNVRFHLLSSLLSIKCKRLNRSGELWNEFFHKRKNLISLIEDFLLKTKEGEILTQTTNEIVQNIFEQSVGIEKEIEEITFLSKIMYQRSSYLDCQELEDSLQEIMSKNHLFHLRVDEIHPFFVKYEILESNENNYLGRTVVDGNWTPLSDSLVPDSELITSDTTSLDLSWLGTYNTRCLAVELRLAINQTRKLLASLEEVMKSPTPSEAEIDETYYIFSKQLAGCQASVDLLLSLSKQSLADEEVLSLQPEIISVKKEFENLEEMARLRQQRMKEKSEASLACPLCCKKNWNQFEIDMWRLQQWLSHSEATQSILVRPPNRMEDLEEASNDHKEFVLDLDSHKSVIMSLNVIGRHLAEHTRDIQRAQKVAQLLDEANLRWESVCTRASTWQSLLQSTLMSNSEFHKTVNDLLKWTREAVEEVEGRLSTDTEDECVLRSQGTRLNDIRSEAERIEPKVSSLSDTANHLLTSKDNVCIEMKEHLDELSIGLKHLLQLCSKRLTLIARHLGPDYAEYLASLSAAGLYESADSLLSRSTSPCSAESFHSLESEQECKASTGSSYRFLGRVMRAALPIQALILVVLGLASLVPHSEEDYACNLANTFERSFNPVLKHDGVPPV